MKTEDLNKMFESLFSVEIRESKQTKSDHVINWLKKIRPKFDEEPIPPRLIPTLEYLLGQHYADPNAIKLPYYRFLLAYAYCRSENPNLKEAETSIRISEREFLNRGKFLQAAISGWLLSLLWCEQKKLEAADEKMWAIEQIFLRQHRFAFHYGHYDTADRELKEKIQRSYENTRQNYASLDDAIEEPNKIAPKSGGQTVTATAPASAQSSTSAVRSRPQETDRSQTGSNIFYVTIPIFSNAVQSPHLVKQINDLLEKGSNPARNALPDNSSVAAQLESLPELIPAIPLYGSVAAGRGEPFQPTGETIAPVDSSLNLKINGNNHAVKLFVKQVNIRSGKKYGWLQVVGQSMNAALDTPINNNDYVLFQEISDMKPYDRKIVIGELSDDETQPPQLVVKRLTKLGDKFFFHSESSLDDPQYKQDIEIIREKQVRGVVVAVAKPK